MATVTTPPAPTVEAASPINISLISAPLSADVQAICSATTAFFTFASSPVGQKLIQAELDAGHALETAVTNVFTKVCTFIHNFLHPNKQ